MTGDEIETTQLADVKVGDTLRCNHGLENDEELCLVHGARHVVKQDSTGELYVDCSQGSHYLIADDDGVLYDFVADEPANDK